MLQRRYTIISDVNTWRRRINRRECISYRVFQAGAALSRIHILRELFRVDESFRTNLGKSATDPSRGSREIQS